MRPVVLLRRRQSRPTRPRPPRSPSPARSVSRRTAFILIFAVGVPLAHGVAPWAIARLSPRHGWEATGPGIWNVVGLLPVALGIAGLVWIMRAAFVYTPERVELQQPAFLLTSGPYAYSRNPMYVSELALWIGWAVFYGSVGVFIGFGVFFTALLLAVRYEERALDDRFGDAYRAYSRSVPRWLGGRPQRDTQGLRCEPLSDPPPLHGLPRSMPSLSGSILRCVLRMRRAAFNWNMSVETLRATQAWSDRVIGAPRRMEIRPALAADVTAAWVMAPGSAFDRVIFYVHGGGWTVGLHNLERRMLARMCRAATVPALAVHYRLAPEQPFPAALEDCVAAYR